MRRPKSSRVRARMFGPAWGMRMVPAVAIILFSAEIAMYSSAVVGCVGLVLGAVIVARCLLMGIVLTPEKLLVVNLFSTRRLTRPVQGSASLRGALVPTLWLDLTSGRPIPVRGVSAKATWTSTINDRPSPSGRMLTQLTNEVQPLLNEAGVQCDFELLAAPPT